MPITSLQITNFRNLAEVFLSPHPTGLNMIEGNNGSGKTSLLEAIHYLGLGRSFRSSLPSRLIRHETEKFSLFAQILSAEAREMPIGVERDITGLTKLRMDGKAGDSIVEIASFLPLRMINSQSHHLFESGPIFRRKYLDWGLFYQAPHFLSCWRNFERALKQRNTTLKERRSKKEWESWTLEFAKHAVILDGMRREYLATLTPYLNLLVEDLLGVEKVKLSYQRGWQANVDFTTILFDSYQEEIRLGYTAFGPHRADFNVEINETPAKHFLSRGQQKLLICAMIIAQGMVLAKYMNKGLIYLIDDLPSELDLNSRQKLISLLVKQQTQIFITAIESESICDFIEISDVPTKVFHVEHGKVTEN